MTTQLELSSLKRDWIEENIAPAMALARTMPTFSTDQLHPVLTSPQHQNWYGVLMSCLKRRGLIQRVGYAPSTRPASNSRVIAVWRACA